MCSVGSIGRYSRKDSAYRYDNLQRHDLQSPVSHREPEVSYRHVRLQNPPLTSQEAIRKLSTTVNNALGLFQDLQSSFACETSQITYVDSQIMDYIWQDKLRCTYDINSREQRSSEGNHGITLQRPSANIETHATVMELRRWLDESISASANEMQRSAGDNRSLAEKLIRSFTDIENSLKQIQKKRKEADTLITELEMLRVLLKRHDGGGISQSRNNADVRSTLRRGSSYEHARVDDEEDEVEDQSRSNDHGDRDKESCGESDAKGSRNGSDWGTQGTYPLMAIASKLTSGGKPQVKVPIKGGVSHEIWKRLVDG